MKKPYLRQIVYNGMPDLLEIVFFTAVEIREDRRSLKGGTVKEVRYFELREAKA